MKRIVIILLLFAITYLSSLYVFHFVSSLFLFDKIEYAKVIRVIDGDTFEIENKEKVRLIGINTPEIREKCYLEAKQRLKDLVENKTVKLVKDKKDRDKYGRLLRYVFVNDTFVNLVLVKEGYAFVYFDNVNVRYLEELIQAEKYAKENKIGCLWKD